MKRRGRKKRKKKRKKREKGDFWESELRVT